MPRSKSHKQSKHNSKQSVTEHSDNDKDDVSTVRDSKNLLSGEKRKFDLNSKDDKDLFGNGDLIDDFVVSKRRKEKVERSRGNEAKESVDLKRRRNESNGRDDSKRKCEKDRKECRGITDKGDDRKDVEVVKKKRLRSVDISEARQIKRSRDITDEVQNPKIGRELEKKVQKREDDLSDKDMHQDDMKNSDDKRYPRGDGSKDGRHKDERHKDTLQEDNHKDIRQRENKLRKDGSRDSRYKDDKYQEDAEKYNRNRDEKYNEDSYRDTRHRVNKYRKDGDRDTRRKEDKCPEHGDKNDRHNGVKYREAGRNIKRKEEKHSEHIEWDSRHKDVEQKTDSDRDREKRAQDVKFKDEHTSKDHGSESETKNAKNESNAADTDHRKSSDHDSSPIYDDRVPRYKDDKDRRRHSDKEGLGDFRHPCTNEKHPDVEKKSVNSGKVNIVTERGWSNSCKRDVDTSLDHSRRRNSPNSSTHAARDHYRVTNPEESKHKEYGYDDMVQLNINSSREFACAGLTEKKSSARPVGQYTQKDDSHFGELSAERRHTSDARASPLLVVDKSPLSTCTERRHKSRSEFRQTLDTEEFVKRRGSSRDYSVRKGKGGRDLQKELQPVDEISQADRDNSFTSSPLKRTSNSSGNSTPLLPPPFRTGLDSPSPFGYSQDDTRVRSNNRHSRNSNSNTERSHANTWKGVPNWPYHVPNGFLPFPHVPPVNFHPVMQQFPAPPIFGVRPAIDLNNAFPFHMPDTERFPGHGHPLGWRNPVGDLCPPVNGWEANNPVFDDSTHGYRRLDWDQNRNQMCSRGWDTSTDFWKGKNNGVSGELLSISQKEGSGTANEVSAGQSGQQEQSELNQANSEEDSLDVLFSDPLVNIIPEAPKGASEESRERSEMSGDDNASHYHSYLSKLDISTNLTQPDLYNQLTSLINMDLIKAEEDNSKMIYLEEILESKIADEIGTDTPFSAINDSVFQIAMSLYKNQREDIRAMKVFSSNMEIPKVVQTYNNEKAHSDFNKLEKGVLASLNDTQTNSAISDYDEGADTSSGLQEAELSPLTAFHKLEEPCMTDIVVVPNDQASMLNEMGMEVDPVSRQVVGDTIMDNISAMQGAELSRALSRGSIKEMKRSDDLQGNLSAANSEDNKLIEAKCAPILYPDVLSGACEALMPELIESESVIKSRIHQYSESKH